jgi:Homeodomain-like domain
MSGPRPAPLTVTARQRAILEQLVRRASSPQQQVRRARFVLAAATGANNTQAAAQAGVSRETARLWRGRWLAAEEALLAAEAEGGAGDDRALTTVLHGVLADEPRPGAPATFTPEQLCQLMALACTPPEDAGRPIDRWTPRELADEAVQRGLVPRISPSTVERFLKARRPAAPSEPVLAHARA